MSVCCGYFRWRRDWTGSLKNGEEHSVITAVNSADVTLEQ